MIYPKIPLAQSIIEICLAKGVTTIVISPGSRNAPLTIGFANNPAFTCYSIADERCAAFFALGMAQQLKKPVAVVCTSGSALLNYYPAVAEAFYSQIPLIVISADRPHDKIDIGDGQTIRQENVYANHILYSANLTEETSSENDKKISEAIIASIRHKGPVHINAPFEEPLYETVGQLTVQPVITDAITPKRQFKEDLATSVFLWNRAKKKLLLVGVNDPDTIDEAIIQQLAADPSVVVMTETTSNLHHDSFLNTIDTIITPFTEADFEAYRPEILITFGGMVVSKRVKAWLRKYKPQEHWHIDKLRAYDTFGALTKHLRANPNELLDRLLSQTVTVESNYNAIAQDLKAFRKQKHDDYLAKIPFSDFKAFEITLSALPDNSQLQVSNSSAIRYAQLFDINPSIEVFCNRGTSGIDGSTSTAIGAAVASGKQTIMLTGDISFLYDSNALWNNYIPQNFKIILINNGGGGIFRILPGHDETPVFNTYFETSHNLTAQHLAKMYGFEYHTATDEATLKNALPHIMQTNNKPQLLEVFTPMLENDRILLQYFKELV
ncbi:2-succinyl-5-enolpyruvyl-6-hydroxy-3-cyclohexene-1-carboxylic-acid synthase [Flavobacterium salilacus subsp. salilacus]|uniref:2-succinyl-5-enolpyruvyl-6-hydroxy-3- cyclohexene-1-carboxylic-acid synthase n=1 Tax=Flavobacterium TaxID=237 RepID=UPI001074E6EA|nr:MULTISPECIES: 2-succinyl-5-enolpyruvyl-6-hydroxy-3-cyclohexene-1-carboxylic-acid synthase [Flavobacterium]KAF2518597.1 2-succinyl-5-enolpyruvyl-6-hydroxy-3-cyclohexene-1-carboxylic-acid synthase [Flavobacterium salilacus subsp. salilacus]MBE1613553.1 2-succinyl-5-enolpyruvyl-6-hydroxy-3-cyclohexene-1-carboxylic-acid synthase [Flavobacterium sp. SaA2.13]